MKMTEPAKMVISHSGQKETAKLNIPHRDKKPDFYCVKTTYHNNGKIESGIMANEKTKVPIAIEIDSKTLDGVFETATATIYYTYHEGYAEAAHQVAMMTGQIEPSIQIDSFAKNHCCRFSFAENRIGNDCQKMFRGRRFHLKNIQLQFAHLLSVVADFVSPYLQAL